MFINVTINGTENVILINVLQIKKVEDALPNGAVIQMMDGDTIHTAETASDILCKIETEYYDLINVFGRSIKIL